jgi:predicted PurR-regulated permease PerM
VVSLVDWAFLIFFALLYLPIKKLLEKDKETRKKTIIGAVSIFVVMVVVMVLVLSRTFMSDEAKIKQDIQQVNKECPIKLDDFEVQSMKFEDNVITMNLVFYEYRESTMEALKENREAVEESLKNIALSIGNFHEYLGKNGVAIRVVLTGNRSNDVITTTVRK